MIPGNPWGLIKDNVIVDIFYAHDYSDEYNSKRLEQYDYDYYIVCDELGDELFVGDSIDELGNVRPIQPYPSWIWDLEKGQWSAPVPMPIKEANWVWNENLQEWEICNPGEESLSESSECCGSEGAEEGVRMSDVTSTGLESSNGN